MAPYWILFSIPSVFVFFERPYFSFRGERTLFSLFLIVVTLFVGLRFEIGSDWFNYLRYTTRSLEGGFFDFSTLRDPGYVFLLRVVDLLGGDPWILNTICAAAFSFGLYSFCMVQPRPWLAVVVSIPYLVIVVAMGYTRQSVALGFAMVALSQLMRHRSTRTFVLNILVAAAFHKSAILLISLFAMLRKRGRVSTAFLILCTAIAAYYTLYSDAFDRLVYVYIEKEYDSDGAVIRVVMNALPAVLFITFSNRFKMDAFHKRLWKIVSVVAILLVPAVFLSPSTTAVDRIALYLIPLQLLVLSRIPDAFFSRRAELFACAMVVLYSATVQFVWLSFGSHARDWIPYNSYLSQI